MNCKFREVEEVNKALKNLEFKKFAKYHTKFD